MSGSPQSLPSRSVQLLSARALGLNSTSRSDKGQVSGISDEQCNFFTPKYDMEQIYQKFCVVWICCIFIF